ncbi:Hpt domain-containing protein [uncultured Gemmiger sp.]|uniref:Hpt domain-containing protein n=1 Tax=uncultured Gemmiger sp. TaxID=1623490 RepID=UPI0025EE426F|nr:Hpt domain-containing protein [uncultured Gemmiger sp.]
MTLQEFYARIGGNYEATLRRLPSEALVRKFVLKYPGDPSFNQLKDALAAQDWETAFRAAHTLKGVAQNLGMDHLYEVSSALCEALRGPKPLTDPALWPPVVEANDQVLAAIQEL